MPKLEVSVTAFIEAVKGFAEILVTLRADVTMSRKMVKKSTKPFWRRTLVRSLFACIEGINHRMKFVAMGMAEVNSVKLSRAEHALLREEAYNLNDNGDAISSKSKLKTADNLLFTLRTTARASKSSYTIDKASENWYSFKEALKIRDRITHPKTSGDLVISDSELKAIQKTLNWYITSVKDVLSILKISLNYLLKEESSKRSLKRDAAKSRRTP